MSIRSAVAVQSDANLVEASAGGGVIDDPAMAALVALCDAVMTRPSDLPPDVIAQLRTSFTHEQLVEITLKVLKFNVQKTMVSLGTDDAMTAELLDEARWNSDGMFVVAD